MFAFDLLRVALAHGMSRGGQVPFIDSSPIGIKVYQPKGFEPLLQLDKYCIGSTTKRIRQPHATQMVNRMPQPALVCFALHETPHLIDLCRFYATNLYGHRVGTAPRYDDFIDLGEPRGFFLVRQSPSLD